MATLRFFVGASTGYIEIEVPEGGLSADNAGTPIPGGPFSAINLLGTLTGAPGAPGVLDVTGAAGAGVTSVTGVDPVAVTAGANPVVSMRQASAALPGYMAAGDWSHLYFGVVQSISVSGPLASSGGITPNLSIPAATDVSDGYMAAADKAKLDGLPANPVTSVGATAPITSSGGATPTIGITAATDLAAGSMSAADKTKLDALITAENAGTPIGAPGAFTKLNLHGTLTGADEGGGVLGITGAGGGVSPSNSRLIYVTKGGNDVTGDGTEGNPFLTINRAITLVNTLGDAATTKRYVIVIGPGDYADNILMPSWTWLAGYVDLVTRLNGSFALDPASWGNLGPPIPDERGGCFNLILRGSVTIDFNAVQSNQGKFYWNNCWINQAPTLKCVQGALASGINQWNFEGCHLFAGLNQFGGTCTSSHTTFQNGAAINLTSLNDGSNTPTNFGAFGGGSDGPMNVVWSAPAGVGPNNVTVNLLGFGLQGPLSLNGTGIAFSSTADGIPTTVTLAGGAVYPTQLTPAQGIEYNDALVAPALGASNVQGAIDVLKSTRIEAQNGGAPLAGGPWKTINALGTLTASDGGGGVLDLTGAGGGGGGTQYTFVLDPLAVAGGNVYQTWAALYPVLGGIPGPKLIECNNTPHIVLAGGPYNLDEVTFVPAQAAVRGASPGLIIDSGATINPCTLRFSDGLVVQYQGITPCMTANGGQEALVIVEKGSTLICSAAGPFLSVTGAPIGTGYLLLSEGSVLGDGTHAVVQGASGGTCVVLASSSATVSDGSVAPAAPFGPSNQATVIYDSTVTLGALLAPVTEIVASLAKQTRYQPTTPAQWGGSPPVQANDAIDRIAAILSNHAAAIGPGGPALPLLPTYAPIASIIKFGMSAEGNGKLRVQASFTFVNSSGAVRTVTPGVIIVPHGPPTPAAVDFASFGYNVGASGGGQIPSDCAGSFVCDYGAGGGFPAALTPGALYDIYLMAAADLAGVIDVPGNNCQLAVQEQL